MKREDFVLEKYKHMANIDIPPYQFGTKYRNSNPEFT